MRTSTALLEEKWRRAMEFHKYLEEHAEPDDLLHKELKQSLTHYRIALANILESRVDRG